MSCSSCRSEIAAAAKFCLVAARAAVWQRDAAAASQDLAATGARGAAMEIGRTTTLAAIAALEGRPDDARTGFREALRGWRSMGLIWDEAMTGINMATILDATDPDVEEAVERARGILEALGACPMFDQLDALIPGSPTRTAGAKWSLRVDA